MTKDHGELPPPDAAVLAVAEAWASIDGKLAKFMADDGSDPTLGYRDGYMTEAATLLERIGRRGFIITTPDALSAPVSVPLEGGEGVTRPDATDLFEAMEAALVEGTPTLSLQKGCIWVDGETAFDARRVLAALSALPSRMGEEDLGVSVAESAAAGPSDCAASETPCKSEGAA